MPNIKNIKPLFALASNNWDLKLPEYPTRLGNLLTDNGQRKTMDFICPHFVFESVFLMLKRPK